MFKESKQKLAEKGITWKEEYTDKTQFLKDQFEDTVGPGSYFRFEGKSPDGDEYYCIIGPAGIHKPQAKFFAGVRKLPATFSAGGKYFDSLDTAARYARETWGIKTPKSLKPYTQKQLFGIAKKVKEWKEEREESQRENDDKDDDKKEASCLKIFDKKYSLNFPITGLNKAMGFPIEFLDKKAMPLDIQKRNRTDYFFTTFEHVMSGKSDVFELLKNDNPSFESALTLIQNEKIKRTCIYMRKYNVTEKEVRNFFRVYVGWCPKSGLCAEFIGPYLMDPKEYQGLGEAIQVYCDIFGLQNTFDAKIGNLFDEKNKDIATHILNMNLPGFIRSYKEYVQQSGKFKNEEEALKEHFVSVSKQQKIKYETSTRLLDRRPNINYIKLLSRIKKVTSSFYTEYSSKFNTFTMAFSVPSENRIKLEMYNIKGGESVKKPSFPELSKYDQSVDEIGRTVPHEEITKDQQAEYIAEHGIPKLSRIGESHFSYKFSLSEGFKMPIKDEGKSSGFFQARSINKGTSQSLIRLKDGSFKRSSSEASPWLTPANSPERYIYKLSDMVGERAVNMVASSNVSVLLNNDGFTAILLNMFAEYPELNDEILNALRLKFIGSEDGKDNPNEVHPNDRFKEPSARKALKEVFSSLPNLIYFLTGIDPGKNNPDSPHAIKDSFKETVVSGLSGTDQMKKARESTGNDSFSPVYESGALNLDNIIRRPGGQNALKESGAQLFRMISLAIMKKYSELSNANEDIVPDLSILKKATGKTKTAAIFSGRTSTLTPDAALSIRMGLINEVAKGMKSGRLEHFSQKSVNYIVDYLNKCGGEDYSELELDQKKRTGNPPFNDENCQFLVFQFLEEKIISEIIEVVVKGNIKSNKLPSFFKEEKNKIANILFQNGHDLIQPDDLDNLLLMCIERVDSSSSEEIEATPVALDDLVNNTRDLLLMTNSKAKSKQGDDGEQTSTNVRYDSDTEQFVQYGYHSSLTGCLNKLREKFFIMSQESSTEISRDPVTKARLVSMSEYRRQSESNHGSRIFSRLPNASALSDYQYNAAYLQKLHERLEKDELFRYRKYRNDQRMQGILQNVEPIIDHINVEMYRSQSGLEGIIKEEDSEAFLDEEFELSEETEEMNENVQRKIGKNIIKIIKRHIQEVQDIQDWDPGSLSESDEDRFDEIVKMVKDYPTNGNDENKLLNHKNFNIIMGKITGFQPITVDDKNHMTSPSNMSTKQTLYKMFLEEMSGTSPQQSASTHEKPSLEEDSLEEASPGEAPPDVSTHEKSSPLDQGGGHNPFDDFSEFTAGREAKNNIVKSLIKMSRELDNEGKYKNSSELLRLAKKFLK
jgi:hypothetical protein